MTRKERITQFLEDTYWMIDPTRRRTSDAYEAVLMRLPDDILDAIVDEQAVLVFAPGSEWGHAYPYTLYPQLKPLPPVPSISDHVNAEGGQRYYAEAKTSVVYLSPELESQEPAVVQAVITHEIAHGMTRNLFGDESERQADSLVQEWGFGVELAALRAANPNHRY